MVERLKEAVKVTLVNGENAEIQLYKTIGYVTKMNIQRKLLEGISVSQKNPELAEIPADRMSQLYLDIANAIWADKNYTIEDVDGESFSEVIEPRLDCFLKGTGYERENGDNTSDT